MQYPVAVQRESLEAKLYGKPFLFRISRQAQQYWWKVFCRRCREAGTWDDPLTFYHSCPRDDQLPVTKRRIYRENYPHAVPPYLTFALTTKRRPFKLE